MRLRTNRLKCGPNHFCQNKYITFSVWIKEAKSKQSPNRRKLAQPGSEKKPKLCPKLPILRYIFA
jgi:hypothetical protein